MLLLLFFVFRRKPYNPIAAEPSRKKKKILEIVCSLIVFTIIFSLYGNDEIG